MSVQTEIVALTESTTELLNAVQTIIDNPELIINTVLVDVSVDPIQTLPSNGMPVRYVKTDATASVMTILPGSGRTVEGQASVTGLTVQGEQIVYGLFGTNWIELQ